MRLLTICLGLPLVAGCVPYHFVEEPGAVGTVTDATSARPVAGAVVVLAAGPPSIKAPPMATMTSDTEGHFATPTKRAWAVLVLLGPIDFVRYTATISVSAPGYGQVIREARSTPLGPSVVDFGEIKLTRVP